MLVVALLDTFYNPHHVGELAPLVWVPSDTSVSSRNLRRLVPRDATILCINSCPYIVATADDHGKPEPLYVASLLRRLHPWDVLLVAGTIAKRTYRLSPYKGDRPVLFIKHPAWRSWSLAEFRRVREAILSTHQSSIPAVENI